MVQADAAERFLTEPLLTDVDRESRRAVLASLSEGRARAGSALLKQGCPNDHLSFLIEGSAAVERSSGGQTEILAQLTAPAVFGTTSFFRPNPPTVTVRATTDVRLLTLDHPAHERLRREHPRAAEALALATLRVLCERFDELDQRIADSIAQHDSLTRKDSEWSGFRARLFEEPSF